MDQYNKNKIKLLIAGGIFLLSISLFSFFYMNRYNYGNEITINGYNKYVKDLPDERRHMLNAQLYDTLLLNNKEEKITKIKDANIREGSATTNYDSETMVHSGNFIVDILSLKQSYKLSYEWSTSKNAGFSGYTALVLCLTNEKTIYPKFDCKDMFTELNKNRDPIESNLPYSNFHYRIRGKHDTDGNFFLNVEIILNSSDVRDGGRQASIDRYKKEITDWITSIGFDPSKYTVSYTIND